MKTKKNGEILNWSIVILNDQGASSVVALQTTSVLIGRSTDADVYLSAPDVSRLHARLELSDEALTIQDLYTSNGTFINGFQLHKDEIVKLKPGDLICLGPVPLLLVASTVELTPLIAKLNKMKPNQDVVDLPTRVNTPIVSKKKGP